jgi:hypothetical protein
LRRLLKFLHTMGAIGMTGAMACLLVVLIVVPDRPSLAGQVAVTGAMGQIATWVFEPSLALTLVAGLLGIAVTPGYHDAGWVWIKAATGILVFEAGLVDVLGPLQAAAKSGAKAIAANLDPTTAARAVVAERNTLWILMGLAVVNVALGVWRPRLPRLPL